MKNIAPPATRLTELRDAWPRVTWREVREADPRAFTHATTGALLIVPAVLCTTFVVLLFLDLPLALPDWFESIRGFALVVAFFAAICLWISVVVLMTKPTEARRAIAMEGFARAVGLRFAKSGFDAEPLGVYFAEHAQAVGPRLTPRLAEQRARTAKPLFRSRCSIYEPSSNAVPQLQVALAVYAGGKHDQRGPRHSFRFLKQKLSRPLPHLMIDAKRNGSLRKMLPGSTSLSFEGDFDRYFTVYVPAGYERDALELFTPDVMVCLIDHGKRWDIEIIENQLIMASSRVRPATDRDEVTAMLHFAELFGGEIGHQASTYSDPRAERPKLEVALGGRRLKRRSETWIWATVLGLATVCFSFPFVLGWIIDRV